jgi:hypothetical protein
VCVVCLFVVVVCVCGVCVVCVDVCVWVCVGVCVGCVCVCVCVCKSDVLPPNIVHKIPCVEVISLKNCQAEASCDVSNLIVRFLHLHCFEIMTS